MNSNAPLRFKSISDYHDFRGLPKPQHPLVSVVNFEDMHRFYQEEPKSIVFDFYSIALKRNSNVAYKYGHQHYDFNEGILFFISPGQVFGVEAANNANIKLSGWMVLVHPDFLWNTTLAKTIKNYDYFNYAINEALCLSDKEETTLTAIVENIKQEYHSNIDTFSQDLIIAQLELLLKYSDRFYNRQFITRKIGNHQIVNRLEELLTNYFDDNDHSKKGLPTVNYIAESLNISPNYLSNMLKVLTGQSTQQHIHDKLISKAKEKLSTTSLSVGEIAFQLGFEHAPSFSKLFKNKTTFSPLEFRNSFN
ncbi:helix-turn-helix domain-containing protein [Flavobacterium sp.]|uniref:helix-turn-helix domain-containing protein n=1 Tax=Flavobacterium sp. TaxID=239 RepID=UPI00374FF5F0